MPRTVEAENAKLRQQVAAVRQFLVDEEFLDENEVDGFMEALVTGEQHENND
jgi:negative regulator of replication initiation